MNLGLICVGRLSGDLQAAEARYLKYLRPYADVRVREIAQGRGRHAAQRMSEEERLILKQAAAGFVLLDVQGRSMDSQGWADSMSRAVSSGGMCFVVGGADGVSAAVRDAAAERWSLSRLTLPHQLVRILLLEQCYRGLSMLAGHPYHRS